MQTLFSLIIIFLNNYYRFIFSTITTVVLKTIFNKSVSIGRGGTLFQVQVFLLIIAVSTVNVHRHCHILDGNCRTMSTIIVAF